MSTAAIPHVSMRDYLVGFGLSVVLTAIPFWLVMGGVLPNKAVTGFVIMGFAVVIASALTGLAVLRMYFSLFCGRPDLPSHPGVRFGLTKREAWTFIAIVIALVAFGIAPRPLVDSRFAASDNILRLRHANMLVQHPER